MAETSVPTNTSLSWSCEDLDGDSLLYDVYLGKTANTVLVASGVSGETYTPVHLEEGTATTGRSLLQTVKTIQKALYGNSPP
jgi:hypothetical protein